MRLRLLRLPALLLAVVVLDAAMDAPRPAAAQAASSCAPGDCLANSAVNNRVQPTSVTTDDRGRRMFATMAQRHFTHALDVGAEEFLD